MTVEVKRRERENNQSLIRRFSRTIKKSGVLIQARKTRFKKKMKSDELKKKDALKKVELREKYKEEKKLGR